MRVGLAILTVAAGAAAAAVWLPMTKSESELAVVTGIDAGGVARVSAPAPDRSSGREAATAAEPASGRFFGFALPAMPSDRSKLDNPAAVAGDGVSKASRQAWPAEIVRGTFQTTVAAGPAVVVPVPALGRPLRERPRHELVREIQRELKRVGCYGGDVDGEWGPGSRRAVLAFMERVNSSVPNDEPDLIQLTLVRGYPGVACARQCPPDRMAPGSGRCLQGPIMATRQAPRLIEERAIAVRPASGIVTGTAAPAVIAAPMLQRTPVVPITSVPMPDAVASAPMSVVPLDGRMAIGGPPVSPDLLAAQGMSDLPPAVTAKPRSPQRSQYNGQRRSDRNWTRTFFDN